MRLIQSRVKCVNGVTDSNWFIPGRKSTLVYGPEDSEICALFKAMESLNPLYDIEQIQPLANHPKEWRQGQRKRRVIPGKKTAVIMVFSAGPDLIRELSELDPALIETDRVEAGRRLDNSRWITFVEISASTRWSEIAESMHSLYDGLMERVQESDVRTTLQKLWIGLKDLHPSERLKGENADLCCSWLQKALPLLTAKELELAKACLFKTERADRFKEAREHVQRWLPPVVRIGKEVQLHRRYLYAELLENNQSVDPVTLLLKELIDKGVTATTNKGENYNKNLLAARENITANISGIEVPAVRVGENGFEIEPGSGTDRAYQRMSAILAIRLLMALCRGRKPLLLLDRLADDLSGDEQRWLIRNLQELSRNNQLILSTARSDIARAEGWQKSFILEQEASTISGLRACRRKPI